MTNITAQEKQALEEVFMCFEVEQKWYKKRICIKKYIKYKTLKFFNKKNIRRINNFLKFKKFKSNYNKNK